MATLIHVTKINGDRILIGMSSVKIIEHMEYTPEAPKPVAHDPKISKPTPVAAPGPVIGSKITFMDGKDMTVMEPMHKISDMQ